MRRFIAAAAVLFLAVFLGGLFLFISYPDLAAATVDKLKAAFQQSHPRPPTSWELFVQILFNNARVAVLIGLAGLVPFLVLPAFFLIANAGLLGLILADLWNRHGSVVRLFSILILPHGIVELPTMVFMAGFCMYLSAQMTKRLFRKRPRPGGPADELFSYVDRDTVPDRLDAIVDIIRFVAGVILPLLVLAAMIEAFVTPLVYSLFS